MERVSVKSLNPQVTRELRIAEKRLRQRVATENLHELAAQQGIQIPDNAVAQASRVNMEFEQVCSAASLCTPLKPMTEKAFCAGIW